MSLKDDILAKAKEIKNATFTKKDTYSIPNIDTSSLTFGCTGLNFPATVLYIDMRGSTKVLNTHQRRVVAKIHMTYYHAIVKIAKADGGEIRSFNGDSLLVFFYGKSSEVIKRTVLSAMKMSYAINKIVNETLTQYTDIDFGIGIDCGDVLATKVGLGGPSDNKDLIWIGNAVNRSTKISDKCNNPFHIGISTTVYNSLDDGMKFQETSTTPWHTQQKPIWTTAWLNYNDNTEVIYKTNYWLEVS
jgi:class 3 adenylate cyclase